MDPVDVAPVLAYQRGPDLKSEARGEYEKLCAEVAMSAGHRWHAPDGILIRLAMMRVVVICDRTAEILLEEGRMVGTHFTKAPPDVVGFAMGLSKNAHDKHLWCFVAAREAVRREPLVFTDKIREVIIPEAQVPHWPGYTREQNDKADWEHPSAVSPTLIRGIARAAREVEADAAMDLSTVISAPPEYELLPAVLRSYLDAADEYLSAAESFFPPDPEGEALATAYVDAHLGFTSAMTASIALCVPQILGDSFSPVRQ